MSPTWLTVGGACVLVLGLVGRGLTQPADQAAGAVGPISCYTAATRDFSVDELSAKRLCIGAASAAPASCYHEVTSNTAISEVSAVEMCRGAPSDAAVACAARLEDTTDLDQTQIAQYCAAAQSPLVASPYGGATACIEAAVDRAGLSDYDAVRICQGAQTIGPVTCFEQGKRDTTLSDSDLIELCTTVTPWQATPSVELAP